MKVRDGMTTLVLTVGPAHTLRDAARMMSARRVGAAVVIDPEHSGIDDLVVAAPDWTLEQAAQAMVQGNFRHLVVIEHGEVAGLLSMRDIVRAWKPADVPRAGTGAGTAAPAAASRAPEPARP
jgi:CBS domain-containing protein